MVKRHLPLLLIAIVLLASYWREVLFLQINALLHQETWNYSNTLPLDVLKNQTTQELLLLKWLLTLVFSIIIGGCTYLTILHNCRSEWLKKIINYGWAFLIGVTLLLGLLYLFTPFDELLYPQLRRLMGLFQTPTLLIILGIITHTVNSLSKLHNPKN
jgi:hypothetical protein